MSKSQPTKLEVLRVEDVTPHMRRVIFGGEGFERFMSRDAPYADRYVKLVFLAPGVDYAEPLDLDVVRETMPHTAWPVLRTYTVRWIDREADELAIDFVIHGDEGLAGPWASAARKGDVMYLRGPGGAYTPDPAADWHLFVGDEAAIPAIGSALETLEAGSRGHAFIEVGGRSDEQPLPTRGRVAVHWLHRGNARPGTTSMLLDAVRALSWPDGRVCAFVHGESGLLKSVRPHLLDERNVARTDLSVSAYWRRGSTEEGFRDWKAAQPSD